MLDTSKYDAFLKDRGQAIFGTTDVGLALEDAVAAVVLAREAGIPILGGDVYLSQSGGIIPAYANWYTSRREGESVTDFAHRTWKETEEYLRQYPVPEGAKPVFALVRAA
jgi:hypothetical protein